MRTIDNFKVENWEREVLESDCPVLVDFRTPACPDFLLRERQLEDFNRECGCSVKIGIVDVSGSLELALACRVQDLPTLCLYRKGRLLKSFSGYNRLNELVSWWLMKSGEWTDIQLL